MNKLKQLDACGQSPWLDYLKRNLIEKGELRALIGRDGLTGVTSNPSIFEWAIGEADEYADALKHFQASADHSISAIYEHLAIADIRAAADVLRPVYEQTQRRDGYISLECWPYLANNTEATVAGALRLWAAVDQPNLMVKVPATEAPFQPRACRREVWRLRGAARLYRTQCGAHTIPNRNVHTHPRQNAGRNLPWFRTALPVFDRASRTLSFPQLWSRRGRTSQAATSRCWWNATVVRRALTSSMSTQALRRCRTQSMPRSNSALS